MCNCKATCIVAKYCDFYRENGDVLPKNSRHQILSAVYKGGESKSVGIVEIFWLWKLSLSLFILTIITLYSF